MTTLKMNFTDEKLSQFRCRTGLRRALGAILLAALLHHPGQAHSAVPPATYSVGVAWDPSSTVGITNYRLHYGTSSGNYSSSTSVGNVTAGTVSGLTGGVTYYFAITAVDAAGLESSYSPEISYAPGLPELRIQINASRQPVLTVSGVSGRSYEIQAAVKPSAWSAIGSVTVGTNGSATFTDVGAANLPSRLYRTRNLP